MYIINIFWYIIMEVNEVAQKAFEYLKSFYPDADKAQLEEAEITDDNKFWLITLSYESKDIPAGPFLFSTGKTRKLKIFKINASTGEVRSMKIRDLSGIV